MRASAAVLAALFPSLALALDGGVPVTFSAARGARFAAAPAAAASRVLYQSDVSDPIPLVWDTVLVQGVGVDGGVSLQAARAEGGAEPRWQTLETHSFPGGRYWAKARLRLGTGPLMLRAVDEGLRAARVVDVYGVEVFAQGPSAAPAPATAASPRGAQDETAARPPVHGRDEWRAVAPRDPYAPDPLPWRITLHHTDGKHTRTLAESEAEARFIQDYHINGRGWSDIGYHFLVDAAGNILEGRPEGVLGAHTQSNNEGNVGIALMGTFQPPHGEALTQAQLDAVEALGRYLVARYGIAPSALQGHRDYKSTDCPGDSAYARLASIRLAIAGPPAAVKSGRSAPAFDGVTAR